MSRSIRIMSLSCFLLGSCQGNSSDSSCIKSDLGRYSFESVRGLKNGQAGCLATYRDQTGKQAVVRVEKGGSGPFEDGGTAVPFEKHFVFHRRHKDGILVGWQRGPVSITVFLQDKAVPQGPVLRAYLYKYHSDITAEVSATRRQVDQLRLESKRRPKDASLHLELARKYRKLGDNVMAAQEYHISVDADRMCYACYYEMGTLYQKLGHWDLAIRATRRAKDLKPKDPKPLILLGDLFYKVHNGQQALINYQKALALEPLPEDLTRLTKRIGELKKGKYMLEVLPGARKKKPVKDGDQQPE
ncbi:MAG: tetratricopeptide repeat protein [Deltaproteobacteria bacterium]|nr:tetratricopeptide repeat protein [Deltaproteobacteria bacterium]